MLLGKKFNRIYKILIACGVLFVPFVSSAAGLVPCNGPDCDFYALTELISNVINFIFVLVIPIAAIVFVYAGLMFIFGGTNAEKRTQAKNAFIKVAVGIVIILAAWLIVATILRSLGVEDSYILLDLSR